ncbi:MAG: glycosyltransferase [Synechococcales cyanobacterium RM1_1_8]|nr:glycosyltransferase [Synechococcales cyanobacterium RM1_1_8]
MPVPFQSRDGLLGFDSQTCQGLMRWTEQFDHVIMASPLMPAAQEQVQPSLNWQAVATLPCAGQLTLVPLPWAYGLTDFLLSYRRTRQQLGQIIDRADYLCFSPSTLIGDWPALAAQEAQRQDRPYSIWIDRVEYDITWRTIHSEPWYNQLKYLVMVPLMRYYQHSIVRRSHLGLFQGQETFSVFQGDCPNSYCVYDVHTSRADQISMEQLQPKLDALAAQVPLRICYMGRAAEMKGPLDWVRAIHRIHQAGLEVEATWLGDGPLFGEMKALAEKLGVASIIEMPGFVGEHHVVLDQMRRHHLLMFCHKTPESPRCLVESLVVGTPIAGYGSAYPEGLVADHGGGEFVPLHQWQQLADRVIELAQDRDRLCQLVRAAARSGQQFSEEDVFAHRSELLRQHLPLPGSAQAPGLSGAVG